MIEDSTFIGFSNKYDADKDGDYFKKAIGIWTPQSGNFNYKNLKFFNYLTSKKPTSYAF